MIRSLSLKQVLISWRRCIEKGISGNDFLIPLEAGDKSLENKQQENSLLIDVFKKCLHKVDYFITGDYLFLLISPEGILLKKKRGNVGKKSIVLTEGMFLTEDSIGTNAIDMSMQLKKAVYTHPSNHYCQFLKNVHLYSIPLHIFSGILGYLALVTSEKQVNRELIAVTDLLGYQITNEYKLELAQSTMGNDNKIKLSNKQLDVLRLIMLGMTDKSIALETHLSFATIRYHKSNIFKKLGVSSSIEAVLKALKLNMVSLNEIDI